jgi:hypothetical protein
MALSTSLELPVGGNFPVIDGGGRSAHDFRIAFRKIQGDYDRVYEKQVTAVRVALADPERESPDLEKALEAHVRAYLIDGILKALRWIITPSTPAEITNVIPEAQVDPLTGARRYMDYFGYERTVQQPLLVVEAKRPSEFPVPPGGSTETASAIVSGWIKKPNDAPGEWKKWIPSLREYVISVFEHTAVFPVRTAITDGNWLVIFEYPEDAFGEDGTQDARYVHVFSDKSDVDTRYDLVFRLLDQRMVSRSATEIAPGGIAGLIAPERVVRLFHGLRLGYSTYQDVGARLIPTISVMPTILLRSDTGSWVRIARREEVYPVPYKYAELPAHLQEVRTGAQMLLVRVQQQLDRPLAPAPLEEHYADEIGFEGMPAVEEVLGEQNHFRIVTGQSTHYLLTEPTVPNCPHHDFGKSAELHCQTGTLPILNRSIENPRAYFTNTQLHHCCHDDVDAAKHVNLSEENGPRSGVRSGRLNDVFCEIAPFEEFLCCRTCCFQQICTATQILRLPCPPPPALE